MLTCVGIPVCKWVFVCAHVWICIYIGGHVLYRTPPPPPQAKLPPFPGVLLACSQSSVQLGLLIFPLRKKGQRESHGTLKLSILLLLPTICSNSALITCGLGVLGWEAGGFRWGRVMEEALSTQTRVIIHTEFRLSSQAASYVLSCNPSPAAW